MTEIELPDRLTVEDDRVIMRGALGVGVLYDVHYDGTPGVEAFRSRFEVMKAPGGYWLAAQDYYQGLTVTTVIRRLSDDRLFGYTHWVDISKISDGDDAEPNGEAHGFDDYHERWCLERAGEEPDDLNAVYVWLPAEPFAMIGYRVVGGGRE